MMSPDSSSEFERMKACGRSVCTTTFGLRGSVTSTPVKFFGALSCASQMMRRPSLAICTDMPSPMPPKPPRSFCARSLKFQVTGSPLLLSGSWAAGIVHSSVPQVLAERLIPIRDGLELVGFHQNLAVVSHVRDEVGWPTGLYLNPCKGLGEGVLR